jgi:hypothetical protein
LLKIFTIGFITHLEKKAIILKGPNVGYLDQARGSYGFTQIVKSDLKTQFAGGN